VSIDDSICAGDSYNLVATGASSYQWEPQSLVSNPNVSFPSTSALFQTTTFVITGYDANNCAAVDSVEIFVYPISNVDAGNDTSICPGHFVQLNATGGESYTWTTTIGLSNFLINNPIANPSDTTIYHLNITDSNNCVQNDSVTVNVFKEANAEAGFSVSICSGESTLLQGSGGVSYNWEPSEFVNHSSSSSPLCFPDDDMNFNLEVVDSNGCNDFDSVQILVFKINASNDTVLCKGDSIQLNIFGDPATNVLWSSYGAISDSSSFEPWVSPSQSTNYYITATNTQGCEFKDTVIVNVPVLESIIDSNLVAGCEGFYVDFINSSSSNLNYKWYFSDETQSLEQSVEKLFDFNSSIEAKLVVENNIGCKDSTSLNINSISFDSIFNFLNYIPPNIFTPNGDGINDLYELNFPGRINECVDLTIYNKWGEIQFSSTGNNMYWDGFTNTGILASQGIYYYTLNLKNQSKSGFLQLFR
jgi:gliding motility-associated-like protein